MSLQLASINNDSVCIKMDEGFVAAYSEADYTNDERDVSFSTSVDRWTHSTGRTCPCCSRFLLHVLALG